MERLPNNFTQQERVRDHKEHPHEDLSKLGKDFENLRGKFQEIFSVRREQVVARTLGLVDKTIGEINSAGLMSNFPALEESARDLHREADKILDR
ncbi:MAG: hypothetical protein HZA94_00405 [Candidatus Vogelbacteria bacterium]|nr:hypothetical protein [Candidatus Vogelbacteria bacterium]